MIRIPTNQRNIFDLETWMNVSALGFSGTWVAGTQTPQFYKDPFGYVHLRGSVQTGTGGTTAFTLPQEYRPQQECWFAQVGGNIQITTAGVVEPQASAETYLDGIYFRTDS